MLNWKLCVVGQASCCCGGWPAKRGAGLFSACCLGQQGPSHTSAVLAEHLACSYVLPRYDKVVDIPNSMTVLPELLPMSIEMAKVRRHIRCAWICAPSTAAAVQLGQMSRAERRGAIYVPEPK